MELETLRGAAEHLIHPLLGRTVGVLGYGNQGHAHALNLRDSGIEVLVGARTGSASALAAQQAGFQVVSLDAAAQIADLAILALPDESQPSLYTTVIEPNLRRGVTVGFLHGFNIRYDRIRPRPDIGVVLVAPKGPGTTLRWRFERGEGIPCLFAVHRESPAGDARNLGLAWAGALGCARAGVIFTTFQDETDTDLFGEQAVLCGGMTQLILAAFETLVSAGYPAELAYLECCHEVKQIADLVHSGGLTGMMEAISNTAEFGAYATGPRIVDAHVRGQLHAILQDIQDGSFARRMQTDYQDKFTWFEAQRRALAAHPIERAGESVRSLMPWLHDRNTSNPGNLGA